MKRSIILALLLNNALIHGAGPYFFCIDGGGSKTALQVIDTKGTIIPLVQQGIIIDHLVCQMKLDK